MTGSDGERAAPSFVVSGGCITRIDAIRNPKSCVASASKVSDNHDGARDCSQQQRSGHGDPGKATRCASRPAGSPVMVQGGERHEHTEAEEPRLVEEEVPSSMTPMAWSGFATYAVSACDAA
jgi:hypothetical protein